MPLYGEGRPFKPPAYKPDKPPVWATYIQSRSPQWKVHSNKGHATNAFKYRSQRGGFDHGGVMYQLVDNRWREYEYFEGPGAVGAVRPSHCAECQAQIWESDYLCPSCRNGGK